MKVMKFGGTSVGSPQRMHAVANLLSTQQDTKLVVLSAVSGTTNKLVQIGQWLEQGQLDPAQQQVAAMQQEYQAFVQQLLAQGALQEQAQQLLEQRFGLINNLLQARPYTPLHHRELLSQGELLSTNLFILYLQQEGISASLLYAPDFMCLDAQREPDLPFLQEKLGPTVLNAPNGHIFLTQGYICQNAQGEIDNLQRGGSDYTASLIGAALQAQEIQIWTDIDGMHNNDPRVVQSTFPIRRLSFNEAAELAYFGAKILHPTSILPAQKFNVPVRLLNTMQPQAPGTIIMNDDAEQGIKAIAAKDGITAIKIKSHRMLLAHGFLRKVFEVFETFRTPIDMITTSEVAVSITIDDDSHLEQIVAALEGFGKVLVDTDQTIICMVGNKIAKDQEVVKAIFNSLAEVPLRMISYGGSNYNVSVLVDSQHKKHALERLNTGLFKEKLEAQATA